MADINNKKLAMFSFFLTSIQEQQEILALIDSDFQRINHILAKAERLLLVSPHQTSLTKASSGELFSQRVIRKQSA